MAKSFFDISELGRDIFVNVASGTVVMDADLFSVERVLDGHDGGEYFVVHLDQRNRFLCALLIDCSDRRIATPSLWSRVSSSP